eukprot:485571-Prorocentrum_minimum.AAC.1
MDFLDGLSVEESDAAVEEIAELLRKETGDTLMIYNKREGSGDQSYEVLGEGYLMMWTFKNGDKRLKARLSENGKYEKWIDVTQWREHIRQKDAGTLKKGNRS